MAYVCRARGEIEARIVFHVKYGGDGREWRTSKDPASDQIGCLSKTIGTRVEYAFHGKRNFANKWLNHGVNHRDVHSKRETLCSGIHLFGMDRLSAFGGRLKISFKNRS